MSKPEVSKTMLTCLNPGMANGHLTGLAELTPIIQEQRKADGGKFMVEKAKEEVGKIESSASGNVESKKVPATNLADEYDTLDVTKTLKSIRVGAEKKAKIKKVLDLIAEK